MEAFSYLILPSDINNFLNKHFTRNTPIFEHYKDHLLNTSFRKDLYVKGVKKYNLINVKDIIGDYKFVFMNKKQGIPEVIQHARSSINITKDIKKHFSQLIDKDKSFNELIYNNDIALTLFYISLFVSKGIIEILQEPKDKTSTTLINKIICEEYSTSNDTEFIGAFNIKSAIATDILDRLFYKFYDQKNISNTLTKVEDYLENKIKSSISIKSKDNANNSENYIKNRFDIWRKETLPLWKKIGVI